MTFNNFRLISLSFALAHERYQYLYRSIRLASTQTGTGAPGRILNMYVYLIMLDAVPICE